MRALARGHRLYLAIAMCVIAVGYVVLAVAMPATANALGMGALVVAALIALTLQLLRN